MKYQFTNNCMSSFALWLDHTILSKGEAYTNFSGSFYPISTSFANTYAYGLPFAQIVSDFSVSGATVITGVYLNNQFITTGMSGFLGINYQAGHALFSNNVNQYPVSGYYSLKDINVLLTDKQDDFILFKTKYYLRPKFPQKPTGILDNNVTYPVIFARYEGGENNPYSFGGTEEEEINIRCIVLADSLYSLHAIQGILKDTVRTPIALFQIADNPYNAFGSLKSGFYNYTGIANNKINNQNFMFINKVFIPNGSQRLASQDLNYDVFFNFVDFEVLNVRNVRST